MRERWLRSCRRLAPASLRARVFDPAAEDLAVRCATRLDRHAGAARRLGANAAWAAAVWLAAVQCWFLPRSTSVLTTEPRGRGDSWLSRTGRDVWLAIRRFRRQPMFAGFAIATLAFGIGANVTVFSFVNAYLIAPINVPGGDRVVRVCDHRPSSPCDVVSYPNYADLRDGAPGLDLAAHIVATVLVGPDEASDARHVELVTGNYFRVLQQTPLLGRLLDARDDVTELAHPVVVLGEAYWRAHEGARADIIGRTMLLNGAPYGVVGIVPASFHGAQSVSSADLWAPIMMQQQLRPRGQTLALRGWGWLRLVGRLGPGVTIAQAQAELDRTAVDLGRRFPGRKSPPAFVATPAASIEESDRAALAPYGSLSLVLTGLLLLVTCANLAGLMEARAIGRRRELAIRQSLGAGRGRLLIEWLTECLLVAAAGGAAGLVLARVVSALVTRLPAGLVAGGDEMSLPLDWRVVAFAVAMSLVAALLVGLPPARRATALGVADVLKDETGTSSGSRHGLRLRRLTVVVQVATAAVLLIGSGLLITSLRNLRGFDPGFRTDRLASMSIDLKRAHLAGGAGTAFTTAMLERVRALPGVVSADVVVNVPLTQNRDAVGFRIPGYVTEDGKPVSIDMNVVGADYFATLGLAFVRGRTWTPAEPAAVVNETMAKRMWAGHDPIGQTVEIVGQGTLSVAGVVKDSAYYAVGELPRPFIYLPAEVGRPNGFAVLARTSGPAEDALANMVDAARSTDARVRPTEVMTFEAMRDAQLYPQRLLTWATSSFGLVALGLTAVGLFGVVSTSVAMRTREIGIRMALGARPSGVVGDVLRESGRLVMIGASAGLVLAYGVAGGLRQWLFGVERFDAAIYVLVAIALGAMTIVAAGWPARRAARIDPVKALRA
ncbi:MAG: ADOP family duplicated permease [Vicinamibacterales bacterium]